MTIKLRKTLFLALFLSCFGMFNNTNAISDNVKSNNSSLTGVTERGKAVFSDYLCLERLYFGPETKHISFDGNEFYTKNIVVDKEISKIDDDATLDSKSKINVDVTFTYDKESFVKINNVKNDIKTSKNSDKWKIGDLTEIYPGKDCCLVSTTYSIFKKSATGLGDKIVDGHMDIMCSKFGDVGFDSELD